MGGQIRRLSSGVERTEESAYQSAAHPSARCSQWLALRRTSLEGPKNFIGKFWGPEPEVPSNS
eukprot:8635511-Heterocapsa_arctica.AAC.1